MRFPVQEKQVLMGMAVFLFAISGLITARALNGTHPNYPDDSVHALAVQSDGKSIIAGRFSAGRIMRLNLDGSFDQSFMSTWTSDGFNSSVDTLAVQSDQKILAGGEFTRFDISLAGHIARLNSDGSVDEDFIRNTGVGFDDAVTSIRVQNDGKIWVGGRFSTFNGVRVPYLARLNADGTLDESYVPNENLDGEVLSITIDESQNKLILGGNFSEKVRVMDLAAVVSPEESAQN